MLMVKVIRFLGLEEFDTEAVIEWVLNLKMCVCVCVWAQ